MADEAKLPTRLLQDADADQLARFRAVLLRGGLRLRQQNGEWFVRSDPGGDFVLLKPLQGPTGALRADAAKTLGKGAYMSRKEMAEMADVLRKAYPSDFVPHSLQAFQLGLLTNVDPMPVIQHFLGVHSRMRLYALRTTERFHFRDVFWRLAISSDEHGQRLVDMNARDAFPGPTAATGIAYVFSAHLAAAPLTARLQPLAAILETLGGIQIVAVSEGAWDRPPSIGSWPSASGYLDLLGEGQDVYRTRHKTIGPDVGKDALLASIRGVNSLVAHLNDPANWRTADDRLDPLERQIAWSSVDLGFNTIAELAREWTSSEALWTAFRALGIVAGFWSSGLDQLLTPSTIQAHAVRHLPEGFLRDTAEDLTSNWARELASMYPDEDEPDAVARVREVRNLVHATAVPAKPGSPKRRARLDALKGTGNGGLALVKDLAMFWWSSLLFSPSTNAISGSAPWADS